MSDARLHRLCYQTFQSMRGHCGGRAGLVDGWGEKRRLELNEHLKSDKQSMKVIYAILSKRKIALRGSLLEDM